MNIGFCVSFPAIIKEFSAKVSALSKEKRRLDKQKQNAVQKRQENVRLSQKFRNLPMMLFLCRGICPMRLQWKKWLTMRFAKSAVALPKGSEAYEFMCNKLNEYLAYIAAEANKNSGTKEDDEKPLFPNSFINELHSRQINYRWRHGAGDFKDCDNHFRPFGSICHQKKSRSGGSGQTVTEGWKQSKTICWCNRG